MVLTRDFRDTLYKRAQKDARFRRALLTEAVNELLTGELSAGKSLLRDCINATLGFTELSDRTGRPGKSLQRMLGPNGNPTADNLFAIIKALQEYEDIELKVKSRSLAA
jgi:DNA-binding phage protein